MRISSLASLMAFKSPDRPFSQPLSVKSKSLPLEFVDGVEDVHLRVPAVELVLLPRLGVAQDDHQVTSHRRLPARSGAGGA